jgi:hypothetical protein
MVNGLDIMNRRTSNMQDVIDITIATFHAGNFVKNWHATEEVSCLDHRYIRFTITGIDSMVGSFVIVAELTGSPLELTCWVAWVV